MESKSFINKRGQTRYRFELTESEFREHSEECGGFCIACGEEVYGDEPDARGYECEACEEPKVYGAEELMMMGFIVIV
jgi:hypothetical protein